MSSATRPALVAAARRRPYGRPYAKITADRRHGEAINQQIVDQIKRHIATGAYRPGERLPSVTELARDLGVDENTVHKAYKRVTQDGLTRGFVGEGTFVVDDALSKPKLYEDVADAVLSPAIASAKALGCARAQLKSTFDRLLGEYFGQKKRVGAHGIRDNRDERPQ